MTKLVFTQQARFKHLSDLAARLERQGKYQDASEEWNKAQLETNNAENQTWCRYRSDFCDRMAERPFGKEK